MHAENIAIQAAFTLMAACALGQGTDPSGDVSPSRLTIARCDSFEWQGGEGQTAVTNYNPAAGFFNHAETNAPTSTKGSEVMYRLREADIGMTFMELNVDWRLGDFLTDIPPDIDWQKTLDAIVKADLDAQGQMPVTAN